MIYTLTCNPALDYAVRLDKFREGAINRSYGESIAPGGKGVNVSLVLKNLGVPTLAMGVAAGFTGEVLLGMLEARGVPTDFLRTDGFTRINVKLKSARETDINGSGPALTEEMLGALAQKIAALPQNACLVLAGSVPEGVSGDFYARLLAASGRDDLRIAVDASGALLVNVLQYRPWLIKPNLEELSEIFGVRFTSREQVERYAHRLCEMGARNVIVSLASNGAMMLNERGEEMMVPAFIGEAVDTVGAGDSLVAAFIAAKEGGDTDLQALRRGVAAGCATAFKEGLATREEIEALLKRA